MCVIAWAWKVHPRYPLVVLANRDERHARPTASLDWWADAPGVLAGRDLEAGGTWLGLSRSGRFAAVTNRPGAKPPGARSRGELTKECLLASAPADEVAVAISQDAKKYAGFNLLAGDGERLAFVSNREAARDLSPGIHGMANGALDETVPKVRRLTECLGSWCEGGEEPQTDAWFALLADARPARSRMSASAVFVRGAEYGTRSSSIVTVGMEGGAGFLERSYGADGEPLGTAAFDFRIEK